MITVVKRNGNRVPLDISKIQRQVANACRGIDGVSPSMIEIKAQIELHDGMSTKTIDELLLKAMANLIDETENPDINNVNYQYVAGRQKVSMLRKEVYGQYTPPSLYDIVKKNVQEKIDALKTARAGNDANIIKSATEALSQAMSAIGEAMKKAQGEQSPAEEPKKEEGEA